MKRIICGLLVIFLLLIIDVYADEICTNNEISRLKELANKVDIHYEYDIKKENVDGEEYVDYNFKLVASNLNSELKVIIPEDYYMLKYREFKYNESKTFTIENFNMGEKVTVEIRAFSNNECAGRVLLTKTISIPYYNSMYESDECKGFEDFIYCKNELTDKEVTFDEFYNKLEEYKKNKKTNEEGNNIPANEQKGNNIYLIIIIILMMFVIGYFIYVYIKKILKKKKENDI